MILAEFGVGEVLLSMFWFFLFFLWIMLLFRVFADVFRSRDLSGVAKVLWLVFVIVLPYLGVFVYLIVRGNKMAEHEIADVQAREAAMQDYIRSAAGTGSAAEELTRLADLRDRGVIDDSEFSSMKAKLVG
jgi:predicted membrane protein